MTGRARRATGVVEAQNDRGGGAYLSGAAVNLFSPPFSASQHPPSPVPLFFFFAIFIRPLRS